MFLRQKGQFFVHISKSELKALYYKALAHFLPTLLSTMPNFICIKTQFFYFYDKNQILCS
ncbi:hypothetical protein FLK62_08190 [Glaesserella parasuis]|uniref:Uncharacterized protein n=1 Tax=Glaesserella parasuis TaxID=738 RepID=A0A859IGV2_GLAPU|nr:hypothetical protein FLK62_08190 [Glaesserella parasuis]